MFDGETDQLIAAILRPGTAHASHGVVGILKQVVRAMQARCPGVRIEFRGDSGFAIPALYDYLEEQCIEYTIGLATNSRLQALATPQLERATTHHAETGEKVRLLGETQCAAGSWDHERRVVMKTEVLAKGPNVRFVVATRDDAPDALYAFYIQRGGGPELWIKDLKDACFADRLSDHTFWANQFRLVLHAAAYWLLDTIRRWLSSLRVARMQLDTLRLWLLKVGGWVRQHVQGIRLHLASSHPGEPLWYLLASRSHRQ